MGYLTNLQTGKTLQKGQALPTAPELTRKALKAPTMNTYQDKPVQTTPAVQTPAAATSAFPGWLTSTLNTTTQQPVTSSTSSSWMTPVLSSIQRFGQTQEQRAAMMDNLNAIRFAAGEKSGGLLEKAVKEENNLIDQRVSALEQYQKASAPRKVSAAYQAADAEKNTMLLQQREQEALRRTQLLEGLSQDDPKRQQAYWDYMKARGETSKAQAAAALDREKSKSYNKQKEIEDLKTQRYYNNAELDSMKLDDAMKARLAKVPELEKARDDTLKLVGVGGSEEGSYTKQGAELARLRQDLRKAGIDEKGIDRLFDMERRKYNYAQSQKASQEWADFADQNFWTGALATFASPFYSLMSGAGVIDQTLERFGNSFRDEWRPMDEYRPAMQSYYNNQAIRGTVSKNIEKSAGKDLAFLYNTGTSILDSGAAMAITSATGLPAAYLLGGSAGTNAMMEAKKRGATDGQAIMMGLVSGVTEELFEELSMERLLKIGKPEGVRQFVKNVVGQSFAEASEEFNTTIANTISDAIIMGDKSEINTSIRGYMAEGMSEAEARKKATVDFVTSLSLDALGGLISGGIMGAGGSAFQALRGNRGANVDTRSQSFEHSGTSPEAMNEFERLLAEAPDGPSAFDNPTRMDPLGAALISFRGENGVSNSQATNILNDAASVETLVRDTGMELSNGMTNSQRRQAVKTAVRELFQKNAAEQARYFDQLEAAQSPEQAAFQDNMAAIEAAAGQTQNNAASEEVAITDDVATSERKRFRSLIPASISQIKTFVGNALKKKNNYQYIKIADVNPSLVNVLSENGIDIAGFSHLLKDNDIRHIDISHGQQSNNKYKVTPEMLVNVKNIIDNYDNLYLGYPTNDGNPTIVFEYADGQRTFYVEERLEEGGLSSKQMLIVGEKSKPSFLKKYTKISSAPDTNVTAQSRTTGQSPPGNHVQDAGTTAVDTTVPQTSPGSQSPENISFQRNLDAINAAMGPERAGADGRTAETVQPTQTMSRADEAIAAVLGRERAETRSDIVNEEEAAFIRAMEAEGISGPEGANPSIGAADQGFTTAQFPHEERTSRLLEWNPYDATVGEATGLNREDFEKMFRYTAQSEAESRHRAEEILYMMQDGKKTFIRDVSEQAYQDIKKSLEEATAWNAPQADAARMIWYELAERSANMDIEETELNDWIRTVREHATAGGQGVQAWAKWSRGDNVFGTECELQAWENLGLDNDNLTPEQRQERMEVYRKIHDYGVEIQKADSEEKLRKIILDIADERGVLNGVTNRNNRVLRGIATKSLNTLNAEQLRALANASTTAMSTDLTPANIGQKMKTIQVLNMLSRPVTAARNIVGNTTFYGIDALAMRGAALLDMGLSHITGTRSVAAGGSSLRNGVKAMQMSIAEITLDVDMGKGDGKYGQGSDRTFRANGNFLSRVLSSIEMNQAYLLQATDQFYVGMAQNTESRLQSLVDQGKIKSENKNYARDQAKQLADYRTFHDTSEFADAIQSIHDVFNMLVGFGDSGRKTPGGHTIHAFGLGDIAAPFTRVAGNLASRIKDYSPYNAVKGVLEITGAIYDRIKGTPVSVEQQSKGVSDLTRGMTGTVLAYGAYLLAISGLLRRAQDEDDKDAQALNQAEGVKGTQLNISALGRGDSEWQKGDTLVDLSSISPFNAILNFGVELANDDDTNPFIRTFTGSLESLTQATSELPVFQFVGNAATDILKYGQSFWETMGRETANSAISSLTPNFVSGLASATDDRSRDLYTSDSLAGYAWDQLRSRLPGARQTLPEKLDNFGRPKVYQTSGVGQFINSMVSPVGINSYQQDDVSRELESVRKETGKTSIYPDRSAPRVISYNKEKYELTDEQRKKYQTEYGSLCHDIMGQLMKTDEYKAMDAEQRAQLLTDVTSLASAAATDEVLSEQGVDYKSQKWDKAFQAVAQGATLREYMTYRSISNALKSGEQVSQTEAVTALEKMSGLADETKGALWQLQNSGWSADKNPYTGTLAKAGIATDTILSIMEKHGEIDAKEGTEARDKATEFSKYLDGLGLSRRQREAVDSTYKYWNFYPAQSRAYNYNTMSDKQKQVWKEWGSKNYSEKEFLRLYGIMTGAKNKSEAMPALQEEIGYAAADDFWKNTH